MLAFSDIIDFLLRLIGDETARVEFDRDPQGALDRAGLSGMTAQDVRDARLQLADSGAVHATEHAPAAQHHGDDPVHEIGYTTHHYVADDHVQHVADHGPTLLTTIDDRDTLFFQTISDDDVTVTDNSVSIADSFNRDDSQVTAIQANGSFNSDDDVTAIQDNDVISDDDVTAIQDNDVTGEPTAPDTTDVPPAVADLPPDPADDPADDPGPAAPEPEPDAPADPVDPADDPVDPINDPTDPLDDPADAVDDPVDDPGDAVDDAPDPGADDLLTG